MSYVIKLIGLANGLHSHFDGEYLTTFDPEFMDGFGKANTTKEIADARIFNDLADVMAFWKTRSTVKPTRSDGRPNRPLTAFSIEPVKIS